MVLSVLGWLRPAKDRLSALVTPETLRRWHRELVRSKWRFHHRINPRKRIPEKVQLLVWRLATENPAWGYRRIQGELKKVGAQISATSVRRILSVKRRPPPKRETWRQFMRAQAASIIACDLFTVESVRLKTLHVLFYRSAHQTSPGRRCDRWSSQCGLVRQIARNLSEAREDRVNPIKYLVHDRDKRFCAVFDQVFCAEGIEILRTPWRAPRANAYAERFIRTVRTECLDRLFIVNEGHLASVLETYVEHYNGERPHRGCGLVPPDGGKEVPPITASDRVKRRDRLGGLIHEYHRTAA
jgi:transposase InsO family protein